VFNPGYFGKKSLPDFEVPFEVHAMINNARDLAKAGVGADHVAASSSTMYLIGYLKYRDEIGLRRTFFCFAYNPATVCFEPFEHHNYSYEE
jgi:hypothetical protein